MMAYGLQKSLIIAACHKFNISLQKYHQMFFTPSHHIRNTLVLFSNIGITPYLLCKSHTYSLAGGSSEASVILLFSKLGPEPAFGRLGLGGSSEGYSSHGYTSHASLRAYGAQLGGDSSSSEDLQNIFDMIYFKQGQWTII